MDQAFISSFTAFCEFLLCYKYQIGNFNGHVLRSFRDKHSTHYNQLCASLDIQPNDETTQLCMSTLYHIYIVALFQHFDKNYIDKDPNYPVKKEWYPVFRALDFFLDENFIKHMTTANNKNKNWNFDFIQPLSSLQSKYKLNFLSKNNSYSINSFQESNSSFASASASASSTSNASSTLSNNDEIASLRSELDQLRSLLVQQNSQQNSVQSQPMSLQPPQLDHIINNELNKLKVQYKNLFSKHKRYSSHIDYFDKYIKDNKVPPSLFNCHFPRPMLPCNKRYVEAYNKLIREFQIAAINLIKHHLNLAIEEDINPQLDSIKSQLAGLSPEVELLINEIVTNTNTYYNTNYAPKKQHKYDRLELKEYKAKDKLDNSLADLSLRLDGIYSENNNNNNRNNNQNNRNIWNNRNRNNYNNNANSSSNRSNNNYSFKANSIIFGNKIIELAKKTANYYKPDELEFFNFNQSLMNLAEQEIKSSSKKEDEQNLKFSIAHS